MTGLRALAPAKVNLALAVSGRRDDGYHLLRSVFLRLGLHDELEVEVAAEANGDLLDVDGDLLDVDGDLPPSRQNLVLRAAGYLRALIDPSLPALRFRLRKRIPVAAGLAGGSSDAAAALDLSLAAWGLRLHPAARLEAALQLGADVPFFAAGHEASLVEGIGEHLVRLPAVDPPAGLVLVTPAERLSTAAVFAELDRRPARAGIASRRVDETAALLRRGIDGATLAAAAAGLADANDLWAAASRLSPGLAHARDAAAASLARPLLLTGSGPTLVAVYPSAATAAAAASRLRRERHPRLAGASILATSSSAPGGAP